MVLSRAQQRRLRDVWRSAGWPCQDLLEAELLAAGLLERRADPQGRETIRVSDAGVQALADGLQRNRGARDAHEALVQRVARTMQRDGRIVWRGLSLRAPLPGVDGKPRWQSAMPDVFSIRHTSLEDRVEPIAHEVKVRRADLLADLRRPDKGAAYAALASECWYVLAEGIGEATDVPGTFGVLIATQAGFEVARPAPRRAMRLPFTTWMVLARAPADADPHDDPQWSLGAAGDRDGPE